MHRFFVSPTNVDEDGGLIVIDHKEDVNHLVKALRVRLGEPVEISDQSPYEYIGEIQNMESDRVTCKIIDKCLSTRESNADITLFQGLPKSGKMDTIVQKSVELGVNQIIPLKTKRIVSVFKDHKQEVKKIERWQKIADEAAKQSKRNKLPQMGLSMTVKDLGSMIGDFDAVFVAYEKETQGSFKDLLSQIHLPRPKIAIVIGPEGGFTEEEVEMLVDKGAKSITLGQRILRTETAGLAAITITQLVVGDL